MNNGYLTGLLDQNITGFGTVPWGPCSSQSLATGFVPNRSAAVAGYPPTPLHGSTASSFLPQSQVAAAAALYQRSLYETAAASTILSGVNQPTSTADQRGLVVTATSLASASVPNYAHPLDRANRILTYQENLTSGAAAAAYIPPSTKISQSLPSNSSSQVNLFSPLTVGHLSTNSSFDNTTPRSCFNSQEEPEAFKGISKKSYTNIKDEGEEKVLIDDFPGQCCRTYPLNHVSILNWRRSKYNCSTAVTAASKWRPQHGRVAVGRAWPRTPKQRGSMATAEQSASDNLLVSLAATAVATTATSGSSIPVGIAIGRQRSHHAASEPRRSSMLESFDSASANETAKRYQWSPLWPSPLVENRPRNSVGPIPMGYQLAKDPLTGQILLIPTESTTTNRPPSSASLSDNSHSNFWPSPFEHSPFHSSAFPSSHQLYPELTAAAFRQHHLYLQHQYQQYQQQLLSSSREYFNVSVAATNVYNPSSNLFNNSFSKNSQVRRQVHEPLDTITLSDDEEVLNNDGGMDLSMSTRLKNDNHSPNVKIECKIPNTEIKLERHENELNLLASPLLIKKEQESVSEPEGDIVQDIKAEENELDTTPPNENIGIDELVDPLMREEEINDAADALMMLSSRGSTQFNDTGMPTNIGEDQDGFDVLITAMKLASSGLDMLCCASKNDAKRMCVLFPTFDVNSSKLEFLFHVAQSELEILNNTIDPLLNYMANNNLHNYASNTMEKKCWQFLLSKMASKAILVDSLVESSPDKEHLRMLCNLMPGLVHSINSIKSSAGTSQLEVQLTGQIENLQVLYGKKYARLAKLKAASSPSRKRKALSDDARVDKKQIFRRPGRPKKCVSPDKFNESWTAVVANSRNHEDPPPPIFEAIDVKSTSSLLLKPPRLTTMTPPEEGGTQITNLSTINERFMKGKANPFANLMQKLTTRISEQTPLQPKSSFSTSFKMSDLLRRGVKTETEAKKPENLFLPHVGGDSDDCESESTDTSINLEDRKTSYVSTKTSNRKACKEINVSKKPPLDSTAIKKRRMSNDPVIFSSPDSSPSHKKSETPRKKSKVEPSVVQHYHKLTKDARKTTAKVQLSNKKSPNIDDETINRDVKELRSATLSEADFFYLSSTKDELRVLLLQEGRFWPANVVSTSFPGIFQIRMEKQRGNKVEHVTQEDLQRDAIFDVKPTNKRNHLPLGTRVCVYWSQAYNCLFPGTVEALDDSRLIDDRNRTIQVFLDDGDRRQVIIEHVRMLPKNYSTVFYDPDPISSLRRHRRTSTESGDGFKHEMSSTAMVTKTTSSRPSNSSVSPPPRIKLDGIFNNTTTYSIRSVPPSLYKEANSKRKEECGTPRKGNIWSTMLPTRGQHPWRWADCGYRRPGSKGKAKKLFHRSLKRGVSESLHVGDAAVFLSSSPRPDRPFIGRIEMLWENVGGAMVVKVKWYYHPEELEMKRIQLKLPGGLFESPHTDENEVQTISQKCTVLSLKEYSKWIGGGENSNKLTYYLAGYYDPASVNTTFEQGVVV